MSAPAPTTEFDLLLASCTRRSPEDRLARIRHLAARGPDWQKFCVIAEWHKVVPHVYRNLFTIRAELPETVMAELCRREVANAQRSLLLAGELVRVAAHLKAGGIPVLPYKGPVLAQLLYGDVGMRQFGDLDLLLQPSDIAPAIKALSELGYAPELSLTEAQQRHYLLSGYERGFHGPYKNLLEIKWRPLPRFYAVDFRTDELWRRAQTVGFAGQGLNSFSKEDLLLVLCVHAAKHVWQKLGWTYDIAELARDATLDWDLIGREARKLGIERILRVTFLLAESLFGADIPRAMVVGMAHDREAQKIKDRICRITAESEDYDTESVPYFRLIARLRERISDRMRFFFRLLVTPGPNEWSLVSLPASLFHLYKAVRLWRLGKRLLGLQARAR